MQTGRGKHISSAKQCVPKFERSQSLVARLGVLPGDKQLVGFDTQPGCLSETPLILSRKARSVPAGIGIGLKGDGVPMTGAANLDRKRQQPLPG